MTLKERLETASTQLLQQRAIAESAKVMQHRLEGAVETLAMLLEEENKITEVSDADV